MLANSYLIDLLSGNPSIAKRIANIWIYEDEETLEKIQSSLETEALNQEVRKDNGFRASLTDANSQNKEILSYIKLNKFSLALTADNVIQHFQKRNQSQDCFNAYNLFQLLSVFSAGISKDTLVKINWPEDNLEACLKVIKRHHLLESKPNESRQKICRDIIQNIDNLVDADVKKSYVMHLCRFYLAQANYTYFNFSEERGTIEDIIDYFSAQEEAEKKIKAEAEAAEELDLSLMRQINQLERERSLTVQNAASNQQQSQPLSEISVINRRTNDSNVFLMARKFSIARNNNAYASTSPEESKNHS